MYDLKGFFSMSSLADNRRDHVAAFGELTTQSKTFTRDMREYGKTTYPDVQFYMFRAIDEMEIRVEPSAAFMDNVLKLGQWVYEQHQRKLIPANKNKPAFVDAIENEFEFITGVVIGEILTGPTPDKNMPDFIQFKMLDGTRQYQITVWCADSAFMIQYPEYEIFLVPPLPDIESLIDGKVAVNNKLLELSDSYRVNAIQDIKQNHPETALITYELTWHDPKDFNAILKTTWVAVIYGQAGVDTEAIKEAIREYIDANSDYDKWDEIYPDLYSENEFIIIPDWKNLALPANALKVGLYGSMTKVEELKQNVIRFLPSGYNKTESGVNHVNQNLLAGSAYYRTLMFGAIGNPNNRNDTFDLKTLYPDYMAVDPQDPDFVRMSTKTQEWTLELNKALNLAFEYLPTSILDSQYTRLIRRGVHYLAFVYDGYTYAVLTKYAFDKGAL